MALIHVPSAGDVLMCDFDGFKPPEMVKKRRVIVLSPRSRSILNGTYLVVPVSTPAPAPQELYHCEFKPKSYAFFSQFDSSWAKADMLCCVGAHRLDRMNVNGRYTRCSIRTEDLHAVRVAVLHALGMQTWRQVEDAVVSKGVAGIT